MSKRKIRSSSAATRYGRDSRVVEMGGVVEVVGGFVVVRFLGKVYVEGNSEY